MQTSYTVMHKGNKVCDITINVAGSHNVLNSLAAVAAALYVNADIESIQKDSMISREPVDALNKLEL